MIVENKDANQVNVHLNDDELRLIFSNTYNYMEFMKFLETLKIRFNYVHLIVKEADNDSERT